MYKKIEFAYKIEKGKKYYKKIVDLPKHYKEFYYKLDLKMDFY